MGTYEIVAVVRPDLDEEGLGAALDRISQRITEHGGAVKTLERWGKRRLAYPIKKYREGYYALFVFPLDAAHIGPLRQTLGLHEDLLRCALARHYPKPVPAAAPAPPAVAAPVTATAPAPAASDGEGPNPLEGPHV